MHIEMMETNYINWWTVTKQPDLIGLKIYVA